jgi:hypothetical protein
LIRADPPALDSFFENETESDAEHPRVTLSFTGDRYAADKSRVPLLVSAPRQHPVIDMAGCFLRRGTFCARLACQAMDSTPFLPQCPTCGFWPMATSEVEFGMHTRIKFVCGKCETVSNATIRQTTAEYQTDNSLAT